MTDILIRNVPDEDLARIDERATRLGLSRGEYLRRRIIQDATRAQVLVSRSDLERFADLGRDLIDEDIMRGAWS